MHNFWRFIVNEATEEQEESIELHIKGDIVDDSDVWIYEMFGEDVASPNQFKDELNAFSGKDITVWIDSYGGSVFAGAGIYNALKEHKGKVVVKIDGKAMSAASVIAMAGDEIQMSPVAVLMIHNPLTHAYGNMHDLRKTADVLDTIKESIVNAYVNKTGRSRNKISQMMDDETWMSANVAVKEGFADCVLYQENHIQDVVSNLSVNRLDIMSGANESIKRAVSLFEKPIKHNLSHDDTSNEAEIKEKILLELDLI